MDIFNRLFFLFLSYAFMGWMLETVYCGVRHRKFINRGFLNGPFCAVYGIAAVVMTVVLRDLTDNYLFLFLGCFVLGTVTEWVAGILLERLGTGKWWDYSGRKGNLGGYICLETSLIWGLLGFTAVRWINPLLLKLLYLIPEILRNIMMLASAAIVLLDAAGSVAAVRKLQNMTALLDANDRIEELTQQFGNTLVGLLARRMERAHPKSVRKRQKRQATVFAEGCGFDKLFWILVIGAFIGDIAETIFVGVTSGIWMSRSSLVWGQFSLVWGIAMAVATAMLYRYREKSGMFLFLFGSVLGGAYEYACNVFTEIAFGTIFWDYSQFQFNLGGRINLLYCFFWGFAAAAWVKFVYPRLSKWIEKVPMGLGKALTWVMAVFLCVDVLVTCGAMFRYQQRNDGIEASNVVAQWIDKTFDDAWMKNRYQNMKFVD